MQAKKENQPPSRPAAKARFLKAGNSDPECSACRDSGFVYVPGGAGVKHCACVRRKQVARKLLELPPVFRESSFDNYVPGCYRQPGTGKVLPFPDVMKSDLRKGFFLAGNIGVGKTHLLAAQFRALAEAGEFRTIYIREVDLIAALQKEAYGESDGTLDFSGLDYLHLFIDDLGKTPVTDDRAYQLFRLIDDFYNREFQISCSTNFTGSQLRDRWGKEYGDPIVKRLRAVCPVWIGMFEKV